jgi:Ca-activated chloride channel homolog
MQFANPGFLLLLIVVVALYFWRKNRFFRSTTKYSNVSELRQLEDKKAQVLIKTAVILRYTVLILAIIALARPQGVTVIKDTQTEGIDIMLALDVSRSMRAEDFAPNNRLTVAKATIREFIKKRQADRIGLVVFGDEAFTQCPLTLDYTVLNLFLDQIRPEMAGSATAIGMAIATGLNRLKNSKVKNKVMILLTDGVSNMGEIEPLVAADLAKDMGVKIYTIAVGKEGNARIPFNSPVFGKIYHTIENSIDEETLKKIAAKTNGLYFRAENEDALKNIYEQINILEKTKINNKTYYNYFEFFGLFLGLSFVLLLAEILITNVVLVGLP